MVDIHQIIKEELSECIKKYKQEHIESEIKALFSNIINNQYNTKDITDIIEDVYLTKEEGDD